MASEPQLSIEDLWEAPGRGTLSALMSATGPKMDLNDEQRAELLVRRAAAFFASLLISPGAGQLALGRRWRGLVWFALGVLTVLPGPLFSIWSFYANLPLRVLSGLDAALLSPPRAQGAGPLDRMPRWATVVGLWCALMAATFGLKLAAPHFYVGILAADAKMAPTVAIDEQVLVRAGQQAEVGDIVAIQSSETGAVTFARVLANGGQRIALRGGVPRLGGKDLGQKALEGDCHYRRARPKSTAEAARKGAPGDSGTPAREERPCRALQESAQGKRYTILVPNSRANDLAAQTLPTDKLWVWGDNRIEDRAPRLVSRSRILGRASAIWWASKPGGLNWERIGKKLR